MVLDRHFLQFSTVQTVQAKLVILAPKICDPEARLKRTSNCTSKNHARERAKYVGRHRELPPTERKNWRVVRHRTYVRRLYD